MDFKLPYTRAQERFRREASAWLDTHIPEDLERPGAVYGLSPDGWEDARAFVRRLGDQGWLARGGEGQAKGEDRGSGGLDPARELVLLEELERRGLAELLEEAAQPLGWAVREWGTEEQKRELLPEIAGGRLFLWRSLMGAGAAPGPQIPGVTAREDGDDYVLNGEGLFAGLVASPNYLWTLALVEGEGATGESTASFLVPARLEGIGISGPRRLVEGKIRRVAFDGTRVPRYYRLGNEGEGRLLMQATFLAQRPAAHMPELDAEVDDLLRYAREATRDGALLIDHPVIQQLLMEAYINSRLLRLFRMRDAWTRASGGPLTYRAAQTRLREIRAALRLSEIVREVMGIYSLLDHRDPRAPAAGRLELQQRQSLDRLDLEGTEDACREEMAAHLGLGQAAPSASIK